MSVAAIEDRQRFQPANHPLWRHVTFEGDDAYVSDMARIRGRLNAITIGAHASIADFVVLTADAPLKIGKGVKVGAGAILSSHAPLRICAGVRIGAHAQLLTGGYDEQGKFWQAPIDVGTGAVIGPGAVVLPGAVIDASEFVQANSVVEGVRCRASMVS